MPLAEVETKNLVEHMPITYDITKDGLFLEGKKAGRQKRNIEIAKNLKKAGVDIKIISKSTGLSVEKIQKL